MKDGNNVRYVQFETNQGMGYGCFMIHWNREDDGITYRVGSSFCNPKDAFSKHLARTIASGRARNNFQFGHVLSNETGFITDEDFGKILADMFKQEDFIVIPNWARKAFSRGKYFFSMRQTRISKGDLQTWKKLFSTAVAARSVSISRLS